MKSSLIQYVIVAIVGALLGVAGALLGFDLKAGVCKGQEIGVVK